MMYKFYVRHRLYGDEDKDVVDEDLESIATIEHGTLNNDSADDDSSNFEEEGWDNTDARLLHVDQEDIWHQLENGNGRPIWDNMDVDDDTLAHQQQQQLSYEQDLYEFEMHNANANLRLESAYDSNLRLGLSQAPMFERSPTPEACQVSPPPRARYRSPPPPRARYSSPPHPARYNTPFPRAYFSPSPPPAARTSCAAGPGPATLQKRQERAKIPPPPKPAQPRPTRQRSLKEFGVEEAAILGKGKKKAIDIESDTEEDEMAYPKRQEDEEYEEDNNSTPRAKSAVDEGIKDSQMTVSESQLTFDRHISPTKRDREMGRFYDTDPEMDMSEDELTAAPAFPLPPAPVPRSRKTAKKQMKKRKMG